MAKQFVYSVFDKAANTYGRPFFLVADGLASRTFIDEINRADQNNSMYMHPEDYVLYKLGEFDDSEAIFTTLPLPHRMLDGQLVKKENQQI